MRVAAAGLFVAVFLATWTRWGPVRPVHRTIPLRAGSELLLRAGGNPVEVTGWDRGVVEIEVRVHPPDPLNWLLAMAGAPIQPMPMEYRVRVPRGAALRIVDAGGSVRLRDVAGPVEIQGEAARQ